MPVEKILRAYIDETTEEEIVEEEVVEPVKENEDTSGNMQDTISAEVQEEIKKAADAIKDKVTINKDETETPETKKENIKLEITDTIQDLEAKIEAKSGHEYEENIYNAYGRFYTSFEDQENA